MERLSQRTIRIMNKINAQLEKIKNENRLGIMTHIVIGNPTLEASQRVAETMIDAGVDFIELQIPFSDPMADGPTIMQANQTALDGGTTTKDAFALMEHLSKKTNIPLLFMTYYNIVFNYGVEQFCKDAQKAGCAGLIVPDMPLEQEDHEQFMHHATAHDLIAVRLLSPASTEERIKKNADVLEGFLYFVGRKGITGTQKSLDQELGEHITRLREHIDAPIAVGFGLSTPEHIAAVKNVGADIAVIGSALLDTYNNTPENKKDAHIKKHLEGLITAAK